jgi:hypothetical protein
MEQRRYQVKGTDDLNDVHIFMTDNRRRAEEVAEAMREDLEIVELIESDGGSERPEQEPHRLSLAEENFELDPTLSSGL